MGPSSQKPWRKKGADVDSDDVQEFWKGLSLAQRRALLRVDKATLFETVRKNLYCCKCHGLLVEGFTQLLLYNRTLQNGQFLNGPDGEYLMNSPTGAGGFVFGAGGAARMTEGGGVELVNGLEEHCKDPLVHPWGGLTAAKDSVLTILDCFLRGDAPTVVFESSRVRERERELLYPDACGGFKGQGGSKVTLWSPGKEPSQCAPRHHNPKESCALHKAKLSCEALVDFWGALGEETRASLLRMKEEDFIERLIKRFESKRFCRDCRRNVLKEFKEMKELRRARRETRCNAWFCMADTTLAHYEITDSGAYASWAGSFGEDAREEYARFQWGLGTSEGNDDLFPFEDVGTADSATLGNLDLGDFVMTPCWLSVRGWKRDGRCVELFAKASPVTKGGPCVHRRLWVGDGYVAINKGESIQRFFEKAEEADEDWLQEDDELSESGADLLDPDAPRQQKHAKSPELARDFLLDAATVIFKEQVEKAFREGTARQNAHSIFVHLSLSLLEEKLKVACREIAALRKQDLLLLEEEEEKKEEEERRERKRLKDREKKQRRKGKDREQKDKDSESVTADAQSEDGKGGDDTPRGGEETGAEERGPENATGEETGSPDVERDGEAEILEGLTDFEEKPVAADASSGGVAHREGGESGRGAKVEEVAPRGGVLLQGKSGGVILDRQVNAVGKKVADLELEKRGGMEHVGKENGRTAGAKLPKAKSSAPIVSSSGTGGVKILVRSIPSVLASTNTKAGAGKTGPKGGGNVSGGKGTGVAKGASSGAPATVKGGTTAGGGAAKGGLGGKITAQRIVVSANGMNGVANGAAPGGAKIVAGGRGAGAPTPILRSVVNGTTGALRSGVIGSSGVNGSTPVVKNGSTGAAVSVGSVLRAGPQVIRATSLPGGAVISSLNGGGGGGTTTIVTQVAPGVTVATKRPSVNPSVNPGLNHAGANGGVKLGANPGGANGPAASAAEAPAKTLSGQVLGSLNGPANVNGQASTGVNGQASTGVNGRVVGAGSRLTTWASGIRNPALLNNKVIRVGAGPGASVAGNVLLSRANSASAATLGGYGGQAKSPPGTASGVAAAAVTGASPGGRVQPVPSPPAVVTPSQGGPLSGHSSPWLASRSGESDAQAPTEPAPFALGHASVTAPYQIGGLLSNFQRSMSATEGALRGSPPGTAALEGGDQLGAGVRAVIGSLPLDMDGGMRAESGRVGVAFGPRSLERDGGHCSPSLGPLAGQQPFASQGVKGLGASDGRPLGIGANGVKGGANGFAPPSDGHIWGPDFSLFSFAAPSESRVGGRGDGGKRENEGGQGEYSLFASAGGGFGFF
ncbi:hypothetical protein KFL_002200100 [Klebsormidium nitens]|uniref:Stress response protein NST1 n=1 Tax=Klebsormidium nitens TaxID=105231 RepID=A0A1Y1I2H2_KLENI|nr:hypothetical protein KFL_002200100 [Klebsormidium nitens]|eukprot:GAQ85125.1 hypothetical protein KFL_002200100 [Klebsormidium nitens]